jgi:hypothetical protein
MLGLGYGHRLLILKLVANVMPIDRTDVVNYLLPCRTHLVCSSLLTVVENMATKGSAESFVFHYCSGAGVVVSSRLCEAPCPLQTPLPCLPPLLLIAISIGNLVVLSDVTIGLLLLNNVE